jgi:hypothetical protein
MRCRLRDELLRYVHVIFVQFDEIHTEWTGRVGMLTPSLARNLTLIDLPDTQPVLCSYEALEAEAEDRRRSLRLITAARAGRVVERQHSGTPVRRRAPAHTFALLGSSASQLDSALSLPWLWMMWGSDEARVLNCWW